MKILFVFAFLFSCGIEPSGTTYRKPGPTNPSPPTPEPNPWSDEIQGIVKEQCALSGCHAGATFVSTGPAF